MSYPNSFLSLMARDDTGQHIFSFFAFISHFWRWSFLRKLVWGFYIVSSLFPTPNIRMDHCAASNLSNQLLLGSFCGKPACQSINTTASAGVFAQIPSCLAGPSSVPDMEAYTGHIACDERMKSEIICPLILRSSGKEVGLGVFDLDCLAQAGFDEDDRTGLEKLAQTLVIGKMVM